MSVLRESYIYFRVTGLVEVMFAMNLEIYIYCQVTFKDNF